MLMDTEFKKLFAIEFTKVRNLKKITILIGFIYSKSMIFVLYSVLQAAAKGLYRWWSWEEYIHHSSVCSDLHSSHTCEFVFLFSDWLFKDCLSKTYLKWILKLCSKESLISHHVNHLSRIFTFFLELVSHKRTMKMMAKYIFFQTIVKSFFSLS